MKLKKHKILKGQPGSSSVSFIKSFVNPIGKTFYLILIFFYLFLKKFKIISSNQTIPEILHIEKNRNKANILILLDQKSTVALKVNDIINYYVDSPY